MERPDGLIHNVYSRLLIKREAGKIAESMGCQFNSILKQEEIYQISRRETGEWPPGQPSNFHCADLTIDANQGTEPIYIAVETSINSDAQDYARVTSSAEILTRLAGRKTRTAIAGTRCYPEIREPVEPGEVHWYDLDEDVPGAKEITGVIS